MLRSGGIFALTCNYNIASLKRDFDAHCVGNNNEAAVSNLFAKGFTFSKPCFYYSGHSFAKSHKLTCCLLIPQFHILYYIHNKVRLLEI